MSVSQEANIQNMNTLSGISWGGFVKNVAMATGTEHEDKTTPNTTYSVSVFLFVYVGCDCILEEGLDKKPGKTYFIIMLLS